MRVAFIGLLKRQTSVHMTPETLTPYPPPVIELQQGRYIDVKSRNSIDNPELSRFFGYLNRQRHAIWQTSTCGARRRDLEKCCD
jgi:hypothetical protein